MMLGALRVAPQLDLSPRCGSQPSVRHGPRLRGRGCYGPPADSLRRMFPANTPHTHVQTVRRVSRNTAPRPVVDIPWYGGTRTFTLRPGGGGS